VITNAKFDKAKLNKIASMTRNAYARCINPVGTMADGDSIYACSVGDVVSDVNLVGTLSAKVMQKAILKAVEAAKIPDEEYLLHCL
jgi:L-aminopeptidase/D-esterase-like protein